MIAHQMASFIGESVQYPVRTAGQFWRLQGNLKAFAVFPRLSPLAKAAQWRSDLFLDGERTIADAVARASRLYEVFFPHRQFVFLRDV